MKTRNYLSLLLLILSLLLIGLSGCRKDSKRKVKKNHRQEVGASAHDLLSDDDYKTAIIEIQYMSGFRPSDQAIQNLKTFVGQRLHKNAITVKFSEISARGKGSYSLDEIRKIEDDSRTEFSSKKSIATYFLFVDGSYSEDTADGKVLGLAYFNTSMVIFEGTITDLTGGFGEPELYKLETLVLTHEFGHILGLVNLGSAMQAEHQDEAHGNHCDNQDCLMNWEAEGGNAVQNLLGNAPIPELDANCLNDLQANGGK